MRQLSLALSLVVAGLFGLAALPAYADTIYLKNGSAIDGTVLGTHDGMLILKIGNVGRMEIAEEEIENIEKNDHVGYVDPGRGEKDTAVKEKIVKEADDKLPEVGDDGEIVEDSEELELSPEEVKEIKQLCSDLPRHKTTYRVRAERKLISRGSVVTEYVVPLTSHPFVRTRVAAFRILQRVGDLSIVDSCLLGLEDEDQFVREMAWKALMKVSGKRYRFPWDDESATEAQRAKYAQRWHRWWDKEKAQQERRAEAERIAREGSGAEEEGDSDSR